MIFHFFFSFGFFKEKEKKREREKKKIGMTNLNDKNSYERKRFIASPQDGHLSVKKKKVDIFF